MAKLKLPGLEDMFCSELIQCSTDDDLDKSNFLTRDTNETCMAGATNVIQLSGYLGKGMMAPESWTSEVYPNEVYVPPFDRPDTCEGNRFVVEKLAQDLLRRKTASGLLQCWRERRTETRGSTPPH